MKESESAFIYPAKNSKNPSRELTKLKDYLENSDFLACPDITPAITTEEIPVVGFDYCGGMLMNTQYIKQDVKGYAVTVKFGLDLANALPSKYKGILVSDLKPRYLNSFKSVESTFFFTD